MPNSVVNALSRVEATRYYYDLPSAPILVARTGPAWEAPTGPEAYSVSRELRSVGKHAIQEAWEDNLALKIHGLLESKKVQWTSTDVVRICDVGDVFAPVVLWIGVVPKSLSYHDGLAVASGCVEVLKGYDIHDVEAEIRESVVTPSAGPKLLTPNDWFRDSDTTAGVREFLTSTLGLPICAQPTTFVEGTGGFFISEAGRPERILLVTARHVLFPPGEDKNVRFEHRSNRPHHLVRLFGDEAFEKYLGSIQRDIRDKTSEADDHRARVEEAEGSDPVANERLEWAQDELKKAEQAVKELSAFLDVVQTQWATPEARIFGHVILSPPISVSREGYTEDWAVIEIDPEKIDGSNFEGNIIDLRGIPRIDFVRMMQRAGPTFKYPRDRLLRLNGIIPDEELRHSTTLDQNGEPHLIVIKRGSTTGLTVGHANQVFSYVRNSTGLDSIAQVSKEWCILPFDSKRSSGSFSEKGDSGSVIVDSRGRIGGLLTGGAGGEGPCCYADTDLTYATPISFLLERLGPAGLHEPSIVVAPPSKWD